MSSPLLPLAARLGSLPQYGGTVPEVLTLSFASLQDHLEGRRLKPLARLALERAVELRPDQLVAALAIDWDAAQALQEAALASLQTRAA